MTKHDPNHDLPELAQLKIAYQEVQAPPHLATRIMVHTKTQRKSRRWMLHAVAATIMVVALLLPIWNSWQFSETPASSSLSLSALPPLPTTPAVQVPGLSNLSGLSVLPRQLPSPSLLMRDHEPQALVPVPMHACHCFKPFIYQS